MRSLLLACTASALIGVSVPLSACSPQEAKASPEYLQKVNDARRNFFASKQDTFCHGPYTLSNSGEIDDCGGIVKIAYGSFPGATEYYLIREVKVDSVPVPYQVSKGKLVEVQSAVLNGCFDARFAEVGATCTFYPRFTAGIYTKGRKEDPVWRQLIDTQFGGMRVLASN
jgi:hypothetical protein